MTALFMKHRGKSIGIDRAVQLIGQTLMLGEIGPKPGDRIQISRCAFNQFLVAMLNPLGSLVNQQGGTDAEKEDQHQCRGQVKTRHQMVPALNSTSASQETPMVSVVTMQLPS